MNNFRSPTAFRFSLFEVKAVISDQGLDLGLAFRGVPSHGSSQHCEISLLIYALLPTLSLLLEVSGMHAAFVV